MVILCRKIYVSIKELLSVSAKCFILSCYLILFDVFEGQLSLFNINRTSTFNFLAENLTLIKRYSPFVFLYCSL